MHAWAQNKEPLKGFCNQRKPHAATCCDLPGLPAWTRFQCHCRTTTRKILFNLHFLFVPLRHEKLSKNADKKNLLLVGFFSQWFSLIYFYVSLIFIFYFCLFPCSLFVICFWPESKKLQDTFGTSSSETNKSKSPFDLCPLDLYLSSTFP